jgi:hypothetical protein
MRTSISLIAAMALAIALIASSTGAAAPGRAPTQGAYEAYASCNDAAPFHAARRCGYDKPRLFRATFVFKSNVGKRSLKACFRVYGAPPLGGGHACAKLKPSAYKAYPFKISGVRQPFAVKVTWFTKAPGSGGPLRPTASSFLKAHT